MSTQSFSHLPDDKDASDRIKRYKNIAFKNGISFSYLVLEALRLYEDENLSLREDLKV